MLFKKATTPEPLKLTFLETFFFLVLIWLTIYGLAGVFLGNLGLFKARTLLLTTGLLTLFATTIPRTGLVLSIKTTIPRTGLVVWLALPIMAFLFFPPFEYLFGGRDPGVYIAVGAGLARKGSLRFYDEQIASLSAEGREFYYRLRGVEGNKDGGDSYRKNRQYPGLFVTDFRSGEITPQFYPLYPVLLAAGYSLGGLIGELAVTPFLAILALVAVYLFARHLFSEKVALPTLWLLLISYPILWYSRYPNSEIAAMLFLFGGGWLLNLAFKHNSQGLVLLSALIFEAAILTRVDNLLLIIPLTLVTLGGVTSRARKLLLFFVALGSLGLLGGIFQGWFFSRPYFTHVVLKEGVISLRFVLSLLVLPFLLIIFKPMSGFWKLLTGYRSVLINLFSLSLFVFVFTLQIIGVLVPSIMDLANLVKLEWYLTPPVVLMGIWGLWRILVRQWSRSALRFFFGYVLFVLIFYLWKARVSLDHPWWVRRFLPVAVPGLILGFCWLVNEWSDRLSSFLRFFILGFVGAIFLLVSFPMIRFNLFQGGIRFVNEAARVIPQSVIVIADDDWGMLATPFYYLFDRQVITLNPDQPPDIRLKGIDRARDIFPERDIWFYSFGFLDQAQPLPSSFFLTAERTFEVRNFGLFDFLPLAPGEEKVMPLRIYQQSCVKSL
jgi:hypothetical protein